MNITIDHTVGAEILRTALQAYVDANDKRIHNVESIGPRHVGPDAMVAINKLRARNTVALNIIAQMDDAERETIRNAVDYCETITVEPDYAIVQRALAEAGQAFDEAGDTPDDVQ